MVQLRPARRPSCFSLTDKPEEADREKFLTGLESGQEQVVLACLKALAELPRDEEPRRLSPLVRLLRQLTLEPKEKEVRSRRAPAGGRPDGRSSSRRTATTRPR